MPVSSGKSPKSQQFLFVSKQPTERKHLPGALRASQQGTLFVCFCDCLFNRKSWLNSQRHIRGWYSFFCPLFEGHMFTSKLIFPSSVCMWFWFFNFLSKCVSQEWKDLNVTTDFKNWFFPHMFLIFFNICLTGSRHIPARTHTAEFSYCSSSGMRYLHSSS